MSGHAIGHVIGLATLFAMAACARAGPKPVTGVAAQPVGSASSPSEPAQVTCPARMQITRLTEHGATRVGVPGRHASPDGHWLLELEPMLGDPPSGAYAWSTGKKRWRVRLKQDDKAEAAWTIGRAAADPEPQVAWLSAGRVALLWEDRSPRAATFYEDCCLKEPDEVRVALLRADRPPVERVLSDLYADEPIHAIGEYDLKLVSVHDELWLFANNWRSLLRFVIDDGARLRSKVVLMTGEGLSPSPFVRVGADHVAIAHIAGPRVPPPSDTTCKPEWWLYGGVRLMIVDFDGRVLEDHRVESSAPPTREQWLEPIDVLSTPDGYWLATSVHFQSIRDKIDHDLLRLAFVDKQGTVRHRLETRFDYGWDTLRLDAGGANALYGEIGERGRRFGFRATVATNCAAPPTLDCRGRVSSRELYLRPKSFPFGTIEAEFTDEGDERNWLVLKGTGERRLLPGSLAGLANVPERAELLLNLWQMIPEDEPAESGSSRRVGDLLVLALDLQTGEERWRLSNVALGLEHAGLSCLGRDADALLLGMTSTKSGFALLKVSKTGAAERLRSFPALLSSSCAFVSTRKGWVFALGRQRDWFSAARTYSYQDIDIVDDRGRVRATSRGRKGAHLLLGWSTEHGAAFVRGLAGADFEVLELGDEGEPIGDFEPMRVQFEREQTPLKADPLAGVLPWTVWSGERRECDAEASTESPAGTSDQLQQK
jgi:hypothetical protein